MVLTKDNLLVIVLTILELSTLSLMNTNSPTWLIIMLYGLLGYGLRELIRKKGLISGNAIYDFFGIIGSTIVAVIFFGEKITIYKIIGLLVGVLSLYLLSK